MFSFKKSHLAFCVNAGVVTAVLAIPSLLQPSALYAQSDTARIAGSVSDSTGAVIPGATITVTNVETNAVVTVTSNGAGLFSVNALSIGSYKASVASPGFAGQVQNFVLSVSQTQALDFKLATGTENTVVEVTSAAPLVDAATSSIGETIEGRQVTELPLNGRNFTGLALLTPGVTRGNYGNSASGVNGDAETFRNASSGGGSLSTNGLRPQANNFTLDGIDNNESLVNTLNFFPNLDGTQEFRVNTSTAPAEFGRAGGSVVQTAIKSGTNQIHGSAFEFARSSLFDASPNYRFQGAGAAPVLPFKRNTFGASLGVPIIKDKLFLFGDYQGVRENTPLNPEILNVPTALERTGNFSELLGQGTTAVPSSSITGCPSFTLNSGRVVTDNNTLNFGSSTPPQGAPVLADSGAIFDPTTCHQFAGNIITAAQANPVGLKYLQAYDLPNVPGTNNGTLNNFRAQRVDIRHFNTFDARLDYNATNRDRLFTRFTYDNSDFNRTSRLTNLPAGFASGENLVHGRGYALGETHTFSTSVLNEFRAGYNRYTFTNDPVFSGAPISANLGIVNANRNVNLGGGALIGGNSNLEYTGDYGRYAVPENTYEINDAVSYAKGRNSFKFGGSAIRRDVAFFRPISGKGYFNFGNADFTGYTPSEVLAGFADNYSIGSQTGFFGTRNFEYGLFVQDDLKLTQRLTLNLGFRYDILTYPTEEHDRQAALDPTTGFIDLANQNGFSRSIIKNNFGDYAPRFGFAYDAYGTGKTVLRGGYGIFYFQDRGGIDNQLGQQVPYGGSVSYTAAQGYRIGFTGQSPLNNNANTAGGTVVANAALPLPGFPAFNRLAPPPGSNVFSVNTTEKTSNVEQYSLQVQQQFGNRTVATVGYVGNKATHLATGYNFNFLPGIAGRNQPRFAELTSASQVVYNANDGVSHYNSLQAQLNYRAAKGLTLTSSYTWSHDIDNTDGYLGFYAVSQLDVYNHALNKGNSSLDQRNVFVTSFLYDLPFGRGQIFASNVNHTVDSIIGGFQINAVVQAETGNPFSLVNPSYGGVFTQRLDSNGPIVRTHAIAGAANSQFFIGNFSAPTATELTGNTGRNQFFGPGLAEGDVSLFKNVSITERFKAELRAEVFNVTNTPQFTNPDGNIQDGNFLRVTGTRQASERQMQMAVRFTF